MTLRLIIGLCPDSTRLIFLFLPPPGLTHTQICHTFDASKQTIINGQAAPCRATAIFQSRLLLKCDTLIPLHIKHLIHQAGNMMSHIAPTLMVIPQLTGYSEFAAARRTETGPLCRQMVAIWGGGWKAQCCFCRLATSNNYTSHTFPHQNCVNVVI